MTKKLYWENPYDTKFQAKVTSIKKNGIVLDKTLFYPESGNQLSDKGNLKIDEYDFKIENVFKEGTEIVHQISSKMKDRIKIGAKVEGKIDWEYRYGLMKAHSSQHIFSAVLKKTYDINTVRANLNFEEVFLQISQKVDPIQLKEILYDVNTLCTVNGLEITSRILPHGEVKEIAGEIRSSIPNEPHVRLMEIEDLDLVCCGGTHVNNTAEIGNLYIFDFKKGTEIKYYVGTKSLLISSSINVDTISLANILNIPVEKFHDKVTKHLEMLENSQNLQKVLSTKLLELTSKLPSKIVNNISLFYIDFDVDIKIINKMLSIFPQNSLLIVEMGDNKIRLLSMSGKIDANEILQKLITKYKGKGGGNPKSAQAVLEKIPENLIYEIEQTLISYD